MHERHTMSAAVRVICGSRGVVRVRPVHDERLQSRPEDVSQIALERADRGGNMPHTAIVRALCTIHCDAASRVERRMLRRWNGSAKSAWRLEDKPLAKRQRRRHDVRQRRQLWTAARRTGRPAPWRYLEMCSGALTQCARGAPRAARAAADA